MGHILTHKETETDPECLTKEGARLQDEELDELLNDPDQIDGLIYQDSTVREKIALLFNPNKEPNSKFETEFNEIITEGMREKYDRR